MSEYLGIYQASVLNGNDPEHRGRVTCLIPQVLGDTPSEWCEPILPTVYTPRVNEIVWVMFLNGDPARPVFQSRVAVTSDIVVPGSLTQESLAFNPGGTLTTYYDDAPPTSPQVGDLWFNTTVGSEALYRWSGTVWQRILDADVVAAAQAAGTAQATADGKVVTFAQNDPPTATAVGDLWIDTNDQNKPYRWSGTSWVLIRDEGVVAAASAAAAAQAAAVAAQTSADTAQATADGKINSFYAATEPTSGMSVGDLWFNTTTKRAWRYNGSAWVELKDVAIDSAMNAAQSAQTTADGKITSFYADSTATPTAEGVGDLWYVTDQGNLVKYWNGSAWVSLPVGTGAIGNNVITTDKLAAGAVTANEIAANAITSTKIEATAIDGKTITGAIVQTAAAGNRLVMRSDASGGVLESFTGDSAEAAPGVYNPTINGAGSSRIPRTVISSARINVGGSASIWLDGSRPDGSGRSNVSLQAETWSSSYARAGTLRPLSNPIAGSAGAAIRFYEDVTGVALGAASTARGRLSGFIGGRVTGVNTDASSQVTIEHGLGATPDFVVQSSNFAHIVKTNGRTATEITFEFRLASTGALVGAGVTVSVDWMAAIL